MVASGTNLIYKELKKRLEGDFYSRNDAVAQTLQLVLPEGAQTFVTP